MVTRYPVFELVLQRRLAQADEQWPIYYELESRLKAVDIPTSLYREHVEALTLYDLDTAQSIKNELFTIFSDKMPGMLRRFLGKYDDLSLDFHAKEDLIQAALYRANQRWEKYEPDVCHLWHWIRSSIAETVWSGEMKRLIRRKKHEVGSTNEVSVNAPTSNIDANLLGRAWFATATYAVIERHDPIELKIWIAVLEGFDLTKRHLIATVTGLSRKDVNNGIERIKRTLAHTWYTAAADLQAALPLKEDCHVCMSVTVIALSNHNTLRVWATLLIGINPNQRQLIAKLTSLDKHAVNDALKELRRIAKMYYA